MDTYVRMYARTYMHACMHTDRQALMNVMAVSIYICTCISHIHILCSPQLVWPNWIVLTVGVKARCSSVVVFRVSSSCPVNFHSNSSCEMSVSMSTPSSSSSSSSSTLKHDLFTSSTLFGVSCRGTDYKWCRDRMGYLYLLGYTKGRRWDIIWNIWVLRGSRGRLQTSQRTWHERFSGLISWWKYQFCIRSNLGFATSQEYSIALQGGSYGKLFSVFLNLFCLSGGFKTLGVAVSKNNGPMKFAGILPIMDPPRHDTKETIRHRDWHRISGGLKYPKRRNQ